MGLQMKESFSNEENRWEVELFGDIDINTSAILKEKLLSLLEEKNEDIVLKSKELNYIDSTGLGVLISVLKKAKNGEKEIIFYEPKSNIIKLLKITGLTKIFAIVEKGDEA